MASLPTSKININIKNYCQIAANIFQGYADEGFESKVLWEFIKIIFEN